jgi:hypothetical protein
MTDVRAEDVNEGDRLPWLEAVEEDEGGDGPSMLKLIAAVVIGLVAIGLIVGGVFWLGNRDARHQLAGGPETIRAPEGPYKVRPDNPGGMSVKGEGETAAATSAGAETKGQLDVNAVPETPVTRDKAPQAAAQPAPQNPAQQQAKATPPAKAPAVGAPAAGAAIQLGAFPDSAAAEKAWKALSGRFGYLAPLSHSVVSANVNGRTWYRLRASGPDAGGICARLQVAGEQCLKV